MLDASKILLLASSIQPLTSFYLFLLRHYNSSRHCASAGIPVKCAVVGVCAGGGELVLELIADLECFRDKCVGIGFNRMGSLCIFPDNSSSLGYRQLFRREFIVGNGDLVFILS